MLGELWIYRSRSQPDHIMLVPVRDGKPSRELVHSVKVLVEHSGPGILGRATEDSTVICVCQQVTDMVQVERVSTTTEYDPRCLNAFRPIIDNRRTT
jgi:hypothetical protein